MNHLETIQEMKNRYFGIRHGQSFSNVLGILVSEYEKGVTGFGLTKLGKKQVRESITGFDGFDKSVILYSSPFLRTSESAEIIAKTLGVGGIIYSGFLKERYFGELDMKTDKSVSIVEEIDGINPDNKEYGVESPAEVLDRITRLVRSLEDRFKNEKIILVSHCDPLRMLERGFSNLPPHLYGDNPPYKNAEIRELTLRR
jgi:broad specificity phosphatase PhoE